MTEYRFEARIEREPSWELMVFCLTMGGLEVAEDADVREVLSIETAMMTVEDALWEGGGSERARTRIGRCDVATAERYVWVCV